MKKKRRKNVKKPAPAPVCTVPARGRRARWLEMLREESRGLNGVKLSRKLCEKFFFLNFHIKGIKKRKKDN